ncbi:MAG: YncE family protein [Thermoplasmataceae archaeon]
MADLYPFKSNTALPKPVTYKDGANIDISSGSIGVIPSPDFAGEISAGKYNLQAGSGLTFNGLQFAVKTGAGLTSVTGAELLYAVEPAYAIECNFAYSTLTDYLYVSVNDLADRGTSHWITSVDKNTGELVGTLISSPDGGTLLNIAISPDGNTLYALPYETDKTIYAIDITSLNVATLIYSPPGGGGTNLSISPSGTVLYLMNNSRGAIDILVIDLISGTQIADISMPSTLDPIGNGTPPVYMIFSPNGTEAYLANVTPFTPIIDLSTNTISGTLNFTSTGTQALFMAIENAGDYLYSISSAPYGSITKYDLVNNAVVSALPMPVGIEYYKDIVIYEPGSLAYVLGNNGGTGFSLYQFDLVNFVYTNNGSAIVSTSDLLVYLPSILLGDEYYVT